MLKKTNPEIYPKNPKIILKKVELIYSFSSLIRHNNHINPVTNNHITNYAGDSSFKFPIIIFALAYALILSKLPKAHNPTINEIAFFNI